MVKLLGAMLLNAFILCAPASASPLLDRIQSQTWFDGLTARQQSFLKWAATEGFKQPPLELHFYSLESEFTLYAEEDLRRLLQSFPAVPHALDHGNDLGMNAEPEARLQLLGFGKNSLKVNYRNVVGWVPRSAIGFDSIIVLKSDGSYVRDIFPDHQWSPRLELTKGKIFLRKGKVFLIARYSESDRGDGERFFAFEYDPQKNEIIDVLDYSTIEKKKKFVEQPLKELMLNQTVELISKTLGFGKTGFVKHGEKLEEQHAFGSVLDDSAPAIQSQKFVLINNMRQLTVRHGGRSGQAKPSDVLKSGISSTRRD